MTSAAAPTSSSSAVGRQIKLPISKAAEIAWQSIRLRLARSLLVTSGIVLSLAFLMSILTSEAMTDSLRRWVLTGPANRSLQRQQLAAQMQAKGVASTPQEIADARIQSRWLVGLALLVAFVGILNAMLMSVTERFREIGTMKCLGALDGFIVKLFLLESLFQGVVGTVIGVILGLGLSLLSVASTYGRDAWRDVPVGQLVARIGVCLIVGIALTVAGAVYPAWQAARMQPIEAMRVET
jgi:predicted lysophospholipase L1 biosynthesis ABC-type transport system permease subunit